MPELKKLYEMQVNEVERFSYQGKRIPEYMVEGIARYLVYGIIPGSFLTAILENDLMEAFKTADDYNINMIKTYVAYLYNEMPIGSYGTKSNVLAWSEMRRAES